MNYSKGYRMRAKKRVRSQFTDKGMQPLGQILFDYALEDKGGRITREFQDYGYRLAVELNDEKNKALYIKLAKEVDRPLLERTRSFVKDAENVKHKGRLFMWALTRLKKGERLHQK